MYKLGWINWARLIVWLVIGLIIYFTYSRYHSRVRNPQLREEAPADVRLQPFGHGPQGAPAGEDELA